MKRIATIITLALTLSLFAGKASAQMLSDTPDLKGRIIYGGNFGFGMNNGYLSLSLAPQVCYRVFNPWEVGIRGIYDLDCRFDRVYGNQYGHYFGVAPYTNVEVFRGLFLHAEDEVLYGFTRWNHQTVSSKWFNTVYVGGGYRQYSYNGSFVYFMILYNLSWDVIQTKWDTPYASPFTIRVGYCFGF